MSRKAAGIIQMEEFRIVFRAISDKGQVPEYVSKK
jgi:hypothetical protein